MKEEKNFTEVIKLRITPIQKHTLEVTACEESMSLSSIARKRLFGADTGSHYAVKIHRNLIKNEIYNTVQSMRISQKLKDELLKELENID